MPEEQTIEEKKVSESIMPEEQTIEEKKVFDITNVEIFSEGTWNGEKFTSKDLNDMVSSFSEIGQELQPFLKIGHDPNQKLVQADGLPAIGWVTNLRHVGIKLIADFQGVPEKIYQLLKKKSYKRISPEIYSDLRLYGKKYNRVLRAVAILGGDTPAVTNLNSILNLFEQDTASFEFDKNEYENIIICTDLEDDMPDEKKVFELEGQIKEFELKAKSDAEEISKLKTENNTLNEVIAKQEEVALDTEIKSYLTDKMKEGVVLPFQEEHFTLLAKDNFDNVKGLLDKSPKIVELTEESNATDKPQEKDYKTATYSEQGDILDGKIQEYMKDNKVNYSEAYDIIVSDMEVK